MTSWNEGFEGDSE